MCGVCVRVCGVCMCVHVCVCFIMHSGMNVRLSAKLATLSFTKALKYANTCSGNTVFEEVTIRIYFNKSEYGSTAVKVVKLIRT